MTKINIYLRIMEGIVLCTCPFIFLDTVGLDNITTRVWTSHCDWDVVNLRKLC